MIRKTISVETIKSMVNDVLLNSEDNYKEGRESLTFFLERVLMNSGNYKGFRYLHVADMKESEYGTTLGINDTCDENEKFKNTDHTRVRYF